MPLGTGIDMRKKTIYNTDLEALAGEVHSFLGLCGAGDWKVHTPIDITPWWKFRSGFQIVLKKKTGEEVKATSKFQAYHEAAMASIAVKTI